MKSTRFSPNRAISLSVNLHVLNLWHSYTVESPKTDTPRNGQPPTTDKKYPYKISDTDPSNLNISRFYTL